MIKSIDNKLFILFTIAIIVSVSTMLYMGAISTFDTASYISAWDNSLSIGLVDLWRTPVYPVFLGICKVLFGACYLRWVIVIQNLLFIVSIGFLWDILLKVTSSRSITFWISLVYSFSPGIVAMNNYLLTESLAISLSIFLAHSLLSLFLSETWKTTVSFTIFLVFVIFLRPAQVYVLPILLLVFASLLLFKGKRSVALKGLAGLMFASLMLLLYVFAFHNSFNVYSPSGISVLNQYYIGSSNGLITHDKLYHREIEKFFSDSYGADTDMASVVKIKSAIDNLGLDVVADEVHISMRRNPVGWVKAVLFNLYRSGFQRLFEFGPLSKLMGPLSIKMSSVYCFMIVFAVLLCFSIIRSGHVPWFMSTIFLLVAGNLAISIVGAQAEWGRLAFPSVPLLLLMFGVLCSLFNVDSSRFSHLF